MGKTIRLHEFSSTTSAETVKEFLERYTGKGTVIAVKLRVPTEGGPSRYALVQFTTSECADRVILLIRRRGLVFKGFRLTTSATKTDIVAKPRSFLHVMENVTLNFGCKTSNEKFSILCGVENADVKFGFGARKIYFFLKYGHEEYKLELLNESIWQLQLYNSQPKRAKLLLFQLYRAPGIYKKAVLHSSGNHFDDPLLNFNRDTPDDQWVRAVDFTPSCAIGWSSAICLELPHNIQLPDLHEQFFYYKENKGPLVLESCSTRIHNLGLVPVAVPPPAVLLPYEILFKVSALVQNGCLSLLTLDDDFFRLVNPRGIDLKCIEHALENLYKLRECCYNPVPWLTEQYRKYLTASKRPKPPAISLDSGLVYVRRVQVTPCKVYFCGPEINVSNRVIRHFNDDVDNFLRVSFLDETLDKMYSTDLVPRASSSSGDRRTGVYKRILSTLKHGILIGNKKFEFLAFSSSQLKENSVWMFASRPGLTASDIREWMGNFSQIRNVAKYAARLGQSFSSSTETLSVNRDETEIIPDVEIQSGKVKYVFSDGIGKISAVFARKVAMKCGFNCHTPSAFQIRYGGYKGVVAVDPRSSVKLSLRKSMLKYESQNTKLDVLGWSKYQPCFLNRELITLLSTLGVRDQVFEKKQRDEVSKLDAILIDPLKARDALELMSPGESTNVLKEMLLCGYKPNSEPFLSMMLQTFRLSKLYDLRTKSRIFIPNGRVMMGCLDETRTLEYGQVFVQFSSPRCRQLYDDSSEGNSIFKGNVVVAKNPCLHPGDVRVLRAVNVPALKHMVDCVVFPQKGERPHTNECSGSDLDGDLYFVCWDSDLIPPLEFPPMHYNPARTTTLDRDVTMEDVEEFFTDYIVNDNLGIIGHAHVAFADKAPEKAMSKPCRELAKLHSVAVDFAKTGIPAEIPPHLRVKEYPDFMEKPDKLTYESPNVIGKLFREIKHKAPETSYLNNPFTREVARQSYDPDMEVYGFEDYLSDAFDYKTQYDNKLGNMMDYFGIKTEAEIISGSLMKLTKSFDRRRDAEAIGIVVRSLRNEARKWFNENGDDDDVYAKASAWYYVTYHHTYWGSYNEGMDRPHFLSFPWCVYDKLIHIKKEKVKSKANSKSRTKRIVDPLLDQFGRALGFN